MSRECTIQGCSKGIIARSMCKTHYERWRRHGDPNKCLMKMSRRGDPKKWLDEHANHDGAECLIWPFNRFPDGRAHMSGEYPARYMCRLIHGDPPTEHHQAAHSCGRGYFGCVHPKHLRWATPKENAADKLSHGTVVRGEEHYAAKLTESEIKKIRALSKMLPQTEIAARFGVRPSCINKIVHRQSWRHIDDH